MERTEGQGEGVGAGDRKWIHKESRKNEKKVVFQDTQNENNQSPLVVGLLDKSLFLVC